VAERAFQLFLGEALELLVREAPTHFAAARERCKGLLVRIAIGEQPAVAVQLQQHPFVRTSGAPEAHVVAATDQDTLDAMLLGQLTIERALLDDRLLIRGELQHALAFLDALLTWIHGAIRCPSFPALYERYLPRS
jgi:hypothetical protein